MRDRTNLMLLLAAAAAAVASGRESPASPTISVTNLRTEHLINPLGLDKPHPRFTWEFVAQPGERAVQQLSYRVQVSTNGTAVWDSEVVTSNVSFLVKYAGPALASGLVYHWSVAVSATMAASGEDGDEPSMTPGSVARGSATAHFSMGMLSREAWGGAQFIGLGDKPDKRACPWLRKSFSLPAGAPNFVAGLVYVASVGYHELTVNGHAASEGVLLPSVSYLPKRVLYRTYNVSALLRPGARNAVGIWASAGWASYGDLMPRPGENNSQPGRALAGLAPLVLARLEVRISGPHRPSGEGSPFSLVSDSSWKARASTTAHLGPWGTGPDGTGGWGTGFGGDALDDTKAVAGWDTPDLDESSWVAAVAHPVPPALHISADMVEPTVRHSTVAAKSIGVFASVDAAVQAASAVAGAIAGCPGGEEPCRDHPSRCCASGNGTCPPRLCPSHPNRTFCPTDRTTGQCDRPMPHTTCPPGDCPLGPPPPSPRPPPGPAPPGGPIHVTMEEVFTGWFEVRNIIGKPHSIVTFEVSTFPGTTVEFNMMDTYRFGSSGKGSFRMRFAYHEIHYITITGLAHPPALTDIVGLRLTSLGAQTGGFSCSSELITSVYHTTVNNYRWVRLVS
jgi:hypothetical protein